MELDELLNSCTAYYDGPGRGRKQCPSCQKYVGVRLHACGCGYDFSSGPTQSELKQNPTDEAYDDKLKSYVQAFNAGRNRIVFTPGHNLQLSLPNVDEAEVFDYCDNAVDEYLSRHQALLHPNALKYMGRFHLGLDGNELVTFRSYVDKWYDSIG